MLFYFVRHGETEANRNQLLAGSGLDHPLTQNGHDQARKLARALRRHIPHPVHKIYVSNMTRARQTAGYLAEELTLQVQIVPDLREWHLGEWEGKTFAEFGPQLIGDGEPAQGESRKSFYSRIERAWQGIHSHTEPYVIVSHGGVWLAMQDILKVSRFKIENCMLVRVRAEKDQWTTEILG